MNCFFPPHWITRYLPNFFLVASPFFQAETLFPSDNVLKSLKLIQRNGGAEGILKQRGDLPVS